MSLYNYPNWHEIKDLVTIYNEEEWDDAKIVVWDWMNQREMEISFCGSTRPDKDNPGKINFIVTPENPTWKDRINWKITTINLKIRNKFNKILK